MEGVEEGDPQPLEPSSSSCCILCHGGYDRKPEFRTCSEPRVKKGLLLFCKLAKVTVKDVLGEKGERGTGADTEAGLIKLEHVPYCGECEVALQELVRLEEIIQESQERQREIVEGVKLGKGNNSHRQAVGGIDEDDDGTGTDFRFRDGDYDSLLESSPMGGGEGNGTGTPILEAVTKLETRACFVRLTRLPLGLDCVRNIGCDLGSSSEGASGASRRLQLQQPFQPDSHSNQPDLPVVRRSKRSMALDKGHHHPSKSKKASLDMDRNRKEDLTPNATLFFAINEDVLLIGSTPVRYSTDTAQLICLEPGCSYSTEGVDYFAFESFRTHFLSDHDHDLKLGIETFDELPCPICELAFTNRKRFRQHVIRQHTPCDRTVKGNVICESCRKRVRCQGFKVHVWLHKSEEEKAEYIASNMDNDKPIPYSIKTKLGGSMSRSRACRQKPQTSRRLQIQPQPASHSNQNQRDLRARKRSVALDKGHPNPSKSKKASLDMDRKEDLTPNATLFFAITDDILLIGSTPVRYSTDTAQLICLEPGCSYSTEGLDYFAFESFRTHFLSDHDHDLTLGIEVFDGLPCPICELTFTNKKHFRQHVIRQHTPCDRTIKGNIICESCLKRVRCQGLKAHVWIHKSEEEKAEYLASTRDNDKPIPYLIKTKLGGSNKSRGCRQKPQTEHRRQRRCKCPPRANRQHQPQTGPSAIIPSPNMDHVPSSQQVMSKSDSSCKTPSKTDNYSRERELFFLLNQDLIFHDTIFIRFSPTELICQERGCGVRVSGSDYNAFEGMRKHVRTKRKNSAQYCQESRYSCLLCSDCQFDDGVQLRAHIFEAHSPPAVCTSCGMTLPPKEMRGHCRSHMNEDERVEASRVRAPRKPFRRLVSYKCRTCQKEYDNVTCFRMHEETHLPPSMRPHFDCPECGKQLKSKVALKTHLQRIHHPEETAAERKRECHICGKQFFYRDGERYRIHMRSHTGETPWVCEFCGAGFVSKAEYKLHLVVHSDARLFQCEYCANSYKHRRGLRLHQRTAHKDLVAMPIHDDNDKAHLEKSKKLQGFQGIYADKRPGFIGPKIAYPCKMCGKVFQIRSLMTKHASKCHSKSKAQPPGEEEDTDTE